MPDTPRQVLAKMQSENQALVRIEDKLELQKCQLTDVADQVDDLKTHIRMLESLGEGTRLGILRLELEIAQSRQSLMLWRLIAVSVLFVCYVIQKYM